MKEEYLAGNDHDREKLEKLLTSLTKEDGTAMYEEKNFAQWVKDAAKKEEQAKNSKDEWAGGEVNLSVTLWRDGSPSRGAKFTLLLFCGEPCLEEGRPFGVNGLPFAMLFC